MRLTLFLITLSVLNSFATESYSQTARLTLNMENRAIRSVLTEIETKSEFRFFYSGEVDVESTASVSVNNQNVMETLDELFKGTGIRYEIYGRQIALFAKQETALPAGIDQPAVLTGKVTDKSGAPMPGVTCAVKGTALGAVTNANGEYSLNNIPKDATLVFSFIGMRSQEIFVGDKTSVNVVMMEETVGIDEVVVIGYGVQKKSDYTGSVSSLKQERLEMVPNLSIAQAIQGSMAGVMMQTSAAGTNPDEVIMIRGRNSILASNDPLIVLDGIPYGGNLRDIDPNDIKSIEVLKDASAAAIYGSRGANGVILVTSKLGSEGKPQLSYDGYYSSQNFVNLPRMLTGEEFYKFKMEREPNAMTQSEKEIYESGNWVDWLDIALRNGSTMKHNLSVAGGFNNTQYYISGGITNVKGLALNDNYKRLTSSINLNSEITKWLTIGTRTQLSYDDASGLSPTFSGIRGVFSCIPLVNPYDENGNILTEVWPEEHMESPLMGLMATNIDESYQVVANNYAVVKIPFVPGLQYRINTGVRVRLTNDATYYGRSTKIGKDQQGIANTNRSIFNNYTVENIVDYNREFGKHNVFITGVYSYETTKGSSNTMNASGFPHDFLLWYSASQADLITPGFSLDKTALISQMLRMNYSFDSRFLLTLTGRRDGYSGFGSENKWGIFPSAALGWNVTKENFFPFKKIFNELKLRASYGLNGNQAVGAYETISRLGQKNLVTGSTTLPGYVPSRLGQDNLGWESTKSLNFGIDFAILSHKIVGDMNIYKSNTSDLLLNRTISAVHGITSITQNIGETENRGIEVSVTSNNISAKDFKWSTTGNMTFNKNRILSLYGELDEEGNEIDDVANTWFIGKPIRVNYGYVWGGVWQLDEKEEAALYGTQPGYVKIKDMNGDTLLTTEDRRILGQKDPKFMWGLNNTLSYKSFTLSVFVHGVHGMTKQLDIMSDEVAAGVTRNTIWKNWWTPENPTNDWYMNTFNASHQNGIYGRIYEKAGFVRIKDVSLSYDLAKSILSRVGFSKCQVFVTGHNLFTFTKWRGLDPELDGQTDIPLQKEYVLGLNLKF